MPQIKRGDQEAVKLRPFSLQASPHKTVTHLSSQNLQSTFDTTIFMRDDAPKEKTCQIDFIRVDKQGQGDTVVATVELNLSMHMGDEYAEQTIMLQQTPAGKVVGLEIQAMRFKARLVAMTDKPKYADLYKICEAWRKTQGPPSLVELTDDPAAERGGTVVATSSRSFIQASNDEPPRRGTEQRHTKPLDGAAATHEPEED